MTIDRVLNNQQPWHIEQGHALDVLRKMPDGVIHCVVTSPPYLGLRDYGIPPQTWGDGWVGSLGLEPTPEMFVGHMVEIFREVRRVLREDGTVWLNLGDSYAANRGYQVRDNKHTEVGNNMASAVPVGLKRKDLIMIPARVALALQVDGLYLRSDIIYEKAAPMPESVQDRPTHSHEYVFLLAKSEKYFYDKIAVMEPCSVNTHSRGNGVNPKAKLAGENSRIKQNPSFSGAISGLVGYRNRRSVWRIASEPLDLPHFAAFPTELVRPCLLAGTSAYGVCGDCGAPWERVIKRTFVGDRHPDPELKKAGINLNKNTAKRRMMENTFMARDAGGEHDSPFPLPETIGWRPRCRCYGKLEKGAVGQDDWKTSPGVVLDPFSGAGTTGVVASRMGLRYIGIELNEEYCRMSEKRILEDAPLFNGIKP